MYCVFLHYVNEHSRDKMIPPTLHGKVSALQSLSGSMEGTRINHANRKDVSKIEENEQNVGIRDGRVLALIKQCCTCEARWCEERGWLRCRTGEGFPEKADKTENQGYTSHSKTNSEMPFLDIN